MASPPGKEDSCRHTLVMLVATFAGLTWVAGHFIPLIVRRSLRRT